MRVILGVSGASGAALAVEAAHHLRALGARIDLVVSAAAERTLAAECGPKALAELTALCDLRHDLRDVGAVIASGSTPVSGMLVAPCSMRSLAAIALGLDDNLLTRAAGVQLKERRPLVLLAREAPLTLAHLRNMTAVTEMGGIVMPPVPAFYMRPETTAEIVQQIAARAVDLMRLGPPVAQAWAGDAHEETTSPA
ncbi:MAG: UbiX family flavin prenyltransferase [Desulfomicrobium sp.]|uniref:UbiX family flavin prenyltransferase n=1 Tax=Hoeflea sp. TaxID=1940281 RepID=UPI0025B7FBEE|nr:UbiX family flavin prenyltransferase [Hoeflea sp.]MBU4528291.1 UbiX family flavin prenyltransferase [Alphaproteobacteria bacterium]MBV1710464.1 UbiX family flavin prenyltransferase [Desulfomicrobium sp.]MBU4543390.1 UbiX family flavin prenyltransferase [Alphaproteobacteria bacterium]MBU4550079.1 UbiX family flavin prenyltransferase [Alphaproteobacteria bacterium]MBV1783688.1 UbiX family flavin prenyltransferase [Hoeflea sp.]